MWHNAEREPEFSEHLELDLRTVVPSSPPKRPQDRILLSESRRLPGFHNYVEEQHPAEHTSLDEAVEESFPASDPAAPRSPTTAR